MGWGWLAVLLILSALSFGADRKEPPAPAEGTRLIVKFKEGSAPAEHAALHQRLGGKFLKALRGLDRTEVVLFPAAREAAALIKSYQQSGLVEYAEIDGVVHALDGKPEP